MMLNINLIFIFFQEIFYESQVSLFQLICQRKELKICFLEKYLNEALNKYPDNFYLLSVFASIEVKLKKIF